MKIAIKGHPTRGEEVIQILKSLCGINKWKQNGKSEDCAYYIDGIGNIYCFEIHGYHGDKKIYTLEEFEKEFPFKVGDKVTIIANVPYTIIALEYYNDKLTYKLDNGLNYNPKVLTLYKEMKEERNITLTLDKAKEWYNKGGELKEVALQAYSEEELTKAELPRTWKEFCKNFPVKKGECWLENCDQINESGRSEKRTFKNWIPSRQSAEAHLAMIQLEQLRNCWWGDWKPEWNASHKYAIKNLQDELTILGCSNVATFLVFPTREMAKEFLECFKDLIEKAGDLI